MMISFSLFIVGLVWTSFDVHAQEINTDKIIDGHVKVIDRLNRESVLAQDEMELFPTLGTAGSLEQELQKRFDNTTDGTVIVRVRQVTNLSGNNPLHTRQPLLNYNGLEVSDLSALLNAIRGNKPATAPGTTPAIAASAISGCVVPLMLNGTQNGDATNNSTTSTKGAYVALDPGTLVCTSGGGASSYLSNVLLHVDFKFDSINGSKTEVLTPASSGWSILNVVSSTPTPITPYANYRWYNNGVNISSATYDLQHTSGRQVRIVFSAARNPTGDVVATPAVATGTLTVTSILLLN